MFGVSPHAERLLHGPLIISSWRCVLSERRRQQSFPDSLAVRFTAFFMPFLCSHDSATQATADGSVLPWYRTCDRVALLLAEKQSNGQPR